MKKVVLLIASISLALLSGCKEKGPVESPSFASFGKETNFESFIVRKDSIVEVNAVAKGAADVESDVPSFSYSSERNSELQTTRTRKGDGGTLTLSDTTLDINQENAGSFDTQNETFAYVEKYKNVINEKYSGGQDNGEQAYTEHVNRQYQRGKHEGEDKIFIFNIYLRTFTPSIIAGEKMPNVSAYHACDRVLSPFSEIPTEAVWSKLPDAKKEEYKFYTDGKTITMTYISNVEMEQKEVIDGEEKITLKSKTSIKRTCQFIIDEKEMKCRSYEENKSTVEKIDYYPSRIISETTTTNLVSAFEGNLIIESKVVISPENPDSYRPGNDVINNPLNL